MKNYNNAKAWKIQNLDKWWKKWTGWRSSEVKRIYTENEKKMDLHSVLRWCQDKMNMIYNSAFTLQNPYTGL